MALQNGFTDRRQVQGWARVNQWLGQYRLLWYAILAVLLMLGFDFKTPAAQFKAVRTADSLKGVRIDSVVRSLGTRDLINVGIARYLCFKDNDTAKLFLPCSYLGSAEAR